VRAFHIAAAASRIYLIWKPCGVRVGRSRQRAPLQPSEFPVFTPVV